MASATRLPLKSLGFTIILVAGAGASRANLRKVLIDTFTGPGSYSRIAVVIALLLNFKSLPFVWHVSTRASATNINLPGHHALQLILIASHSSASSAQSTSIATYPCRIYLPPPNHLASFSLSLQHRVRTSGSAIIMYTNPTAPTSPISMLHAPTSYACSSNLESMR